MSRTDMTGSDYDPRNYDKNRAYRRHLEHQASMKVGDVEFQLKRGASSVAGGLESRYAADRRIVRVSPGGLRTWRRGAAPDGDSSSSGGGQGQGNQTGGQGGNGGFAPGMTMSRILNAQPSPDQLGASASQEDIQRAMAERPWEYNANLNPAAFKDGKLRTDVVIDFGGTGSSRPASTGFDPNGSGYDYASAREAGMGPATDGPNKGHWSSRRPLTPQEAAARGVPEGSGLLLKGRTHETWNLLEQGEKEAGMEIFRHTDGRFYSKPINPNAPPSDTPGILPPALDAGTEARRIVEGMPMAQAQRTMESWSDKLRGMQEVTVTPMEILKTQYAITGQVMTLGGGFPEDRANKPIRIVPKKDLISPISGLSVQALSYLDKGYIEVDVDSIPGTLSGELLNERLVNVLAEEARHQLNSSSKDINDRLPSFTRGRMKPEVAADAATATWLEYASRPNELRDKSAGALRAKYGWDVSADEILDEIGLTEDPDKQAKAKMVPDDYRDADQIRAVRDLHNALQNPTDRAKLREDMRRHLDDARLAKIANDEWGSIA